MESILVLNVPEDFDYRRCSIGGDGNIYYEREGEQRTSIIGNIKNLKPMPQKNKYDIKKYATVDYENNVTLGHYLNIGWNECMDEIVGEPGKQKR